MKQWTEKNSENSRRKSQRKLEQAVTACGRASKLIKDFRRRDFLRRSERTGWTGVIAKIGKIYYHPKGIKQKQKWLCKPILMKCYFVCLQVKIWFQNRRSKFKKMMKAAQGGTPGGSQPPGSQQENSNETMSPQPPDSFPSQPGDLSPPPNPSNQVGNLITQVSLCQFANTSGPKVPRVPCTWNLQILPFL